MRVKRRLSVFKNAVEIRLPNKSIKIIKSDKKQDSLILEFMFADSEPHQPAAFNKCLKGKVRYTQLRLSNEAMQELVTAYINYMQNDVHN